MKKSLIWIVGLIILAVAYLVFFTSDEGNFLRVLVFSKTESYRHDSIVQGHEAMQKLGKENDFEVIATEDAEMFTERILKDFNVIVFLNTTGDVLNESQQLELNRYIQAGGGFVGIHAAADTEYDWPWYNELVGAWFASHPNDPNVREASIDRIDKEHISTKHLPERWTREDEWYNYKEIQTGINVLLNLDESSYEGGTNGKDHPIAWYREFDGGRSWYTGMGHTPETFSDPLFIEMLIGGINYAAGPKVRINYDNANVAPDESRFTKEVLADNLNEPMELEMLPNGNILFIQRRGEVMLHDFETNKTSEIQKINVFSDLEDGLLGMALDPDFQANKFIYLFYSNPVDSMQIISRFTMNDNYTAIQMESELQLLTIPVQRETCCHAAGSMEFGKSRNLFIATGDNTNPHASDGYNPIDEQPGRSSWDAQKSSANANDLRGKILRVTVDIDGTVTIPEGNLFPKDGSKGRPEIYVMGCRNPYRISIDQRTGDLYWGDVGPDAGIDSTLRGPKGHDEVNKATQAGFYGWPYFIGDNKPYYEYDFVKKQSGDAFNPEKPINNSPNNTGIKELPPAQPAFLWYPYDGSDEFPLLGDGGRTAMAGPVFYIDDYKENDLRFPEYYNGKLFIYEWMRGWIIVVSMDEQGNYSRMERFLPGQKFNNPVDMIFSPQGDIYLLEYGTAWFKQNEDARLVHLKYISGNRAPIAKIQAGSPYGKIPFEMNLSSEGSKDLDGDKVNYSWFVNGEKVSEDQDITYTFSQPGEYVVKLEVRDTDGETDETSMTIKAGNALPIVKWEFVGNRMFYWDNISIDYKVIVDDEEDGKIGDGIDPSAVDIAIDFLERGHDITEIVMGHEALSAFSLGESLIGKSDCAACHKMNEKSVGPSFIDIASKYKNEEAKDYLISKIIKGGGGVWGEIAMAAHPQMKVEEVGYMVDYILKQAGKTKQTIPYEGSYSFSKHVGKGNEGKYILSAAYTDKGGNQIGSLTSSDVVVLRSPFMMADEAQILEKVQKFDIEAGSAPGVEQDVTIVIGEDEGYAVYQKVDLTGVKSILLGIGLFPQYFVGGKIEILIDEPTGTVIGSVDVVQGLTDIGEKKLDVTIEPVTGLHDLFIKFKSEDGGAVCSLVYMIFNN